MNKYGCVAMDAVASCTSKQGMNPVDAWDTAAIKHFGEGTASQKKGCPKSAFLGLCSEGYVKGIPSGEYTSSQKNKKYAIDAVALLRLEPNLTSDIAVLWKRVLNGQHKQHNSQMDVVRALWQGGMLNKLMPPG